MLDSLFAPNQCIFAFNMCKNSQHQIKKHLDELNRNGVLVTYFPFENFDLLFERNKNQYGDYCESILLKRGTGNS